MPIDSDFLFPELPVAKVDQLPAELHVEIYQGDAWSIAVDFNLDLTGYTITATVHPKGGASDGSDDVSMTITETDYTEGTFVVSMTDVQTADLDADYHDWCLKMTPPASTIRTFIAGRFIVGSC